MIHDGAPAHFSAPVHNLLNMAYPGQCIGYGGPYLWPPPSPDLTLLECFPMGKSQEIGVSRQCDNTNGLHYSSACCLYFGGRRAAAKYAFI
ncbi:uncharacterized protein TNCV_2327061 [Trichonephila clavipes]|nr:uncharacterized protein TNCV_2327061 [Trichonephila clavipes]